MVGLPPTLFRASRGYLLRHPWSLWLSVLGIGLGVAVVIAVDLANQSARSAFRLSMEAVTGRATHRIVGAPGGIPESLYRDLRLAGGHWPAAPVIEGTVQYGERDFTLLGLDPLADRPFREGMAEIGDAALRRLLLEPAGLLLPEPLAAALDIGVDDRLDLQAAGVQRRARVVGLFRTDNPAARDGLLMADIATAQELLGRIGVLDHIDLILAPTQVAAVQRRLPPGLRLERPATRTASTQRMTAAFHTNLAAMSLLALLVGGFIIYNSITFSVLQRRALLGHLRVLGVTRRELFALVLAEALLLGIVGTVLGLLAGSLIAQGLVQLVTRTINDLYFGLTVNRLLISPAVLLKGSGVGLGATLLAALVPALEAARSEPRDVQRRTSIERRSNQLVYRGAAAGLALLAAGMALSRLPGADLIPAFTALFMVIAGFSLLVPLLLSWLTPPLQRLLGGLAPPVGRLAVRGIGGSLSRTGPALAALTVAVSATVGVGIMIESFRTTVDLWLRQTLTGDIYVSTPTGMSHRAAGALPAEALARIRGLPNIADISQGRSVRIESEHGEVELLAIRMARQSYGGFRFKGPTEPDLWPRFDRGELILVSEPEAYRHDLRAGGSLRLFSAGGWRDYRIGGVFYDYGNGQGMLAMAKAEYAAHWDDPGTSALGIGLQDPARLQPTLRAVRAALAPLDAPLRIRATGELRRHSLEVFDRTFAITRVLRLLAVGVAFIGILSALLALHLERARDHAVLRASGATPGQMLGLVTLQSALLGLLAGVLALPLGWLMAELLIDVINLRSFGWTMQKLLPPGVLLQAVGLALLSALLAGLYPAWRVSRARPADALRSE